MSLRIALVCTRGFADVLTLGRQSRHDPYSLHVGESPWNTLVPARCRIDVPGRIDASGQEVQRLEAARVVPALQALVPPPQAVVVALLFAHRNPQHEQQVRDLVQAAFPALPVVCSHECDPEGGEYQRTVAALQAAGVHAPVPPAPADREAMHGAPAQFAAIAQRMQEVVAQKAFSTTAREAGECAAALFLPDGRMVAQPAGGLPLLVGSLSPAVQGVLAEFPASAMEAGEGYISNDPWRGGTNLLDIVLLRPVFAQGAVQALAACILHHQDVGGMVPGSLPPDATSVHQEGLRIPPVRLFRQGQTDAPLFRLLCTNSRTPDNLAGDIRAQWAALVAADEAVQALLADPSAFLRDCEATLADSERRTRAALGAAPDGDYRFTDALDGDCVSLRPVRFEVLLRKTGDELVVDLTHCDAQALGPANASRGATWAAVHYLARMIAPHAAGNDGCTAPIQLRTAPGTVVHPSFPAAVNARTGVVKLLANALLGAWGQALPLAVPAPNAGADVTLTLSGTREDGRSWLVSEVIASAAGAAPWGPGGSGVSTDLGNAANLPAEMLEAQAPIRVDQVGVRIGSGGGGRHRGGDGAVRVYRLLEGTGMISYRGERHRTPAQGTHGGGPGLAGAARIESPDGRVQLLSNRAEARWSAGDRLVIETAGAGGWGTRVPEPTRPA